VTSTGINPGIRTLCSNCVTPADTSCTNGIALYQRHYYGNKGDFGQSAVATADSGWVVVGYTNSYGAGGSDGQVTRLNKGGQIVWSKAIGGSLDDNFYKIKSTADGGYIAVGMTKSYGGSSNGSAWMVKLDANGVVQWSRRYNDGNADGSIAWDVTQTSDGGYAIAGTNQYTPGLANAMVIKTDNNGNVSWSKSFNSGNSDQATGILEDAGNLVVSAFQYGQSSSYYDGIIMKLDLGTGNVIWARSYEIEGKSNWFGSVSKRSSGYGIYCYNSDDFFVTNPSQVAVNVDSQGLPVELRKVTASPARDIGAFTFTADGGLIVTQMDLNSTSDVYVGKMSSGGALQWSRKMSGAGLQRIVDARQATDGGFLLVGNNNGTPAIADSSDLFVIRTDSTGNTPGCNMESTTFQLSTPPYTVNSNFNWSSITNITYSISTSVAVTSTSITPGIRTLCFGCAKVTRPTGTFRATSPSTGPHVITLYPNPTNGRINILIDARYDDVAEISVIDWNSGNVVYKSARQPVYRAGQNQLSFNLTRKLAYYRYYIVKVTFSNYEQAIKVFSVQ
jgi:hypothetical protein